MQNKSHAVMAQRNEPKDSRDDFPTPPWATRGLLEYVLGAEHDLKSMRCLEPACGAGHMAKVLQEYFAEVDAADFHNYGYGELRNFMTYPYQKNSVDWVITNPPFNLAEHFTIRSLEIATRGVAILARTVFLESVGRYERIFKQRPPTRFVQFSERVPMVKGRLDPKATTATGYAWFVWEKVSEAAPRVSWIPPCRKILERAGDYDVPQTRERINPNQEAFIF